jgi:hypothetical protein
MSEHEEYRSLFLERDEPIATRIPVAVLSPIQKTIVVTGHVLSKDMSNDLSKDQDIKK